MHQATIPLDAVLLDYLGPYYAHPRIRLINQLHELTPMLLTKSHADALTEVLKAWTASLEARSASKIEVRLVHNHTEGTFVIKFIDNGTPLDSVEFTKTKGNFSKAHQALKNAQGRLVYKRSGGQNILMIMSANR